jgi:hypothetical protein
MLQKWGSSIENKFVSKVKKHPSCYLFEYKQELSLQYGLPENKPSIENILNEFAKYFKTYMFNETTNDFIWSINGGYGINTLLKHKFNYINIIPSYNLDIGIQYDNRTINSKQLEKYIMKVKNHLQNFFELMYKKYNLNKKILNFIEHSTDKKYLVLIKYQYCDEDQGIIDLAFVGIDGGVSRKFIDKEISEQVGLPIKTSLGYYVELKDLLLRENIKDLDPDTYDTRNLEQNVKGRKTIKRLQAFCKIDKNGRKFEDYDKMCNLLEDLDINILIDNKEKLEKLLTYFKQNKSMNIIEDIKNEILLTRLYYDGDLFNWAIRKGYEKQIKDLLLVNNNFNSCINKKFNKNVIKWLLLNGIKPDKESLNLALEKNYDKTVLELIINNGIKPDKQSLKNALINKYDIDILILLINKGAKTNEETLDIAIDNLYNKQVLELLIKNKAKPSIETIKKALYRNYDINVLKWLNNNGAYIDSDILSEAMYFTNDRNILEFLIANGAEITDEVLEIVQEDQDLLEWLLKLKDEYE